MNSDSKFIKKIRLAIEEETYDNLDMDEWEIIETLLNICEAREPNEQQILNENDVWRVIAKTRGCKSNKEDCTPRLCHNYFQCSGLVENLEKETNKKSECGVKNG